MRYIDVNVQNGFLRRRGLRGRWLTVYFHRYGGAEVTERLHSHPWRYCFGVVLWGKLRELVKDAQCASTLRVRGPGSFQGYRSGDMHRIIKGRGASLFLGFGRTQRLLPCATERVPEGFAHYSEVRDTL